ncbi:MAG TPA: hypothetical protein VJ907_06785 [Halanaerobiales bacterium]|nr:hypothetical protein [Halanaerobiales bacterium]
MAKQEKSRKEKIYKYLKIGVLVVFALWLVFSVNGVQNQAKENKNVILRPKYEVTYLPGGPERFVGGYRDVVNEEKKKNLNTDNYLWTTVLVKNEGNEDAKDINITINSAYPMAKVLVNPSGYSNETDLNTNDDNLTTKVDIEDLEIDNKAFVFIGFQPSSIEKPYDQADIKEWTNRYQNYLQNVNVESLNTEDTFYVTGYRDIFKTGS